ncbi:MBL fold metallo-hydrolase [Geobacillus uzenensis]|uniref:MBL fold metallo-hydrolase n=1 Tax=Geobacillus uzenensis TaxID=129339 RepID=A0ABX4DFF2_9BACL|nr:MULTISPECIES: MBL fold metallo-hydrolase [Geobacillus]KZS24395.1 MBL fold metallo-hydrolase [Geobacillus subterraneus]OXB87616.1 MBL fold metallo-hydrolase [Geobacillus uzenensis]
MWIHKIIKKRFETEMVNNVHIAKATASFQGVRLTVRCFIVDGVLIDTGAKSMESEFASFFQQHDIDQVVITHFHEDHTGCAAFLQQTMGLSIYMNEPMIDYCRQKADYPLYRKIFWGKRDPFAAEPIDATFSSRNATWEVIPTPGHAIDHVVFLNRETGQLFSGDLYCQEKTKVILREEDIPAIIASLQHVLTYDFGDVFCAHAGYLPNGREALRRKLDYLLELQDTIIDLYENGMPPKQIQALLFPKKYPIVFFSGGEWDSLHIIRSVIRDYEAKQAS